MTQEEVIQEYMDYLENEGILDEHKNPIPNWLTIMKTPRDLVLDSLMKEAKRGIIDLGVLTIRSRYSFGMLSKRRYGFIREFNSRHKEEILSQYNKTVKMVARYARESNFSIAIEEVYGGKEKYMTKIRGDKHPMLVDSFPRLVTRHECCMFTEPYRHWVASAFVEGFTEYYTKMMMQQ